MNSAEQKIAVIEEQLRGMEKALALQAKEYNRRLDMLNHAHEEAVRIQHTYVTEQVHERDITAAQNARNALVDAAEKKADGLALALTEAKITTDARFQRVEAFQAKLVGALALGSIFVPLATGIIVYVLTH